MRLSTSLLFIFFLSSYLIAQTSKSPKLVVGIVVDQMRYDYLEKFYNDFDEGGFKKLINNGTNFTNCKINYVPTVTGAGHASIYTGTVPYFHGIIANDWIDKKSYEGINCVTAISPTNKMFIEGISKSQSPEQLLSTTIGDQLKLNNFGKSKVVSISIKDRGAILPAGKGADAAFWYDDETGKFISSFYYMNKLPQWMTDFNNSGIVNSYLEKEWNLYKSGNAYEDLPEDNSPYETDVFNEGKTSFPHTLKNVSEAKKYSKMTYTPWGNQILIDLAKEVLKNERLGLGKYTDHLAISFSTPDKIGHAYGIQSYEVKDTYLRLDKQIADLFKMLDQQVGEGNYLLFLTADHGGMENTQHLIDMKHDAGVLENTNFYENLTDFLESKYGSSEIIKSSFSRNLYLDYEILDKLNLTRSEVQETIKEYILSNVSEITEVFTRNELETMSASRNTNNYILNGFNKQRSGDILYSLKTFYLNNEKKLGTQHGSRHIYDNHIPLIFYGSTVPSEIRNEEVYIEDIAATVCDFLGITQPSDCIGIPLLKK
ncbi:MAG: alkaline phosphatase family protein [Ignavibacteriae bacterium]|nr:alkaline phosphatase family protein [Ignavibacteriota bacterium]